ncbi:MaoC family dehydratase [Catenulispora yoronensis]|uniref:MaoC family dehydratase n=1 Tax=Catenulispora yoronensis TaxID=450799 RepID=A0ABP5GV52_9ACTN
MKVVTFEELAGAVGEEFAGEEWLEITQEQIDQFAAATGDHQWIHVDQERAKEGPYGRTIAHGFLTLALMVPLSNQVVQVTGTRMGVNYGLDRVRFITPVPVGSRVRAKVRFTELREVEGGWQLSRTVTIELEGAEKPACVAESLVRLYP